MEDQTHNSVDHLRNELEVEASKRRRLEEALAASEQRYENLLNSAQDVILTISRDGLLTSLNSAFERITGWSRSDWIGQPFLPLLHPDDISISSGYFNDILQGRIPPLHSVRILSRNGKYLIVDLTISPQTDRGKIVGILGLARDMTAQREAEEQLRRSLADLELIVRERTDDLLKANQSLRQSEERFEKAFRASPVGFLISRASDGAILEMNDALEVLLGYTSTELSGSHTTLADLIVEGSTRKVRRSSPGRRLQVKDVEVSLHRKNGERRDVLLSSEMIMLGDTRSYLTIVHDITEEKQAEMQLRDSEQKYRVIVEGTNAMLFTADRRGFFTYANEASARVLGVPAEALKGQFYLRYVHPDDRTRVHETYTDQFRHGYRSTYLEFRYRAPNGNEGWMSFFVSPVFSDGHVTGMTGVAQEISERKRIEASLKESEERYRLLVEGASEYAIIMLDLQGNIESWNSGAQRIFGYAETDVVGKNFSIFFDEKAIRAREPDLELEQAMKHGEFLFEGSRVRKGGTTLWAAGLTTLLRDEEGRPRKFAKVAHDITARRAAEIALLGSQARLARAQRMAHLGNWELDLANTEDLSANRLDWSEEVFRIFGLEPAVGTVSNDIFFRSVHPDDREAVVFAVRTALDKKANYSIEHRIIRPDGSMRTVAEHAEIEFDAKGKPARLIGTVQDITEQKRAEESLRESEERFRQLAENVREVFWISDTLSNTLLYVSPAFETVWGRSLESLYQHPSLYLESIHTDDRENAARAHANQRKGLPTDEIYRVIHPDGSTHWVRDRAFPIKDESGRVYRVAGVAEDISERKRYEQQLQQLNTELEQRVARRTEQLAMANKELEAFSYSISHDLRAPLRSINGFSTALLDEYGDQFTDAARRYLEIIRNSAVQMSRLIDDLLEFSRLSRQELRKANVDLSQLVRRSVSELTAVEPQRNVSVEVQSLPSTRGDRNLLYQVVMNLLSNAFKFTRYQPSPKIEVGSFEQDGQTVYYVKDNGAGFDDEYAEKLFGVFQRLHSAEEFEGTGVGLAIVQRIVSRHGGKIWAESKPGRGATFFFTLSSRSE